MADISVADIKALRDATGVGMMDAKKALADAGCVAKRLDIGYRNISHGYVWSSSRMW